MLSELRGRKVLMVASTGGHLAELIALGDSAGVSSRSIWVTPDTIQSRGALVDRRTLSVPYIAPRGALAAVRASRRVARLLRTEHFDYCVSTGAAIAVSVLPLAAHNGIASLYVESLARHRGPSLTGRILHLHPRVQTLTQSPLWASSSWPYRGSLLDNYVAVQSQPKEGALRIFISLGTIRPFRFDRAIDAILPLLRPDDDVTWQLGSTVRENLPGRVCREIEPTAMRLVIRNSDVVLTHAGVGSVLDCLSLGKPPLLLVRRRRYHEHVDDHQLELAEMIQAAELGAELDLSCARRATLQQVAGLKIVSAGFPT